MKKFYTLAAVALMAAAANAQNGAPLYATGAGGFVNGEWNPMAPDEFVYADGKYTLEIKDLTQIKISTSYDPEATDGGWAAFNKGAYDCPNGYGDVPGVAVEIAPNENAQNIACPWKGDYTVTVAGDLSTITLSTDTPAPTGETPIYLRGDMNTWGTEEAWELKSIAKGIYKFTCADDQLIAVGETFKIADADWNKYNVGGDGEPLLLDEETPVFNGGNPANMQLEEEWNGVVYLNIADLANCSILFSNNKETECPWPLTDGVEGVVVENNASTTYYTLQGVRVANPENGLFIVVKDGKANKVFVK